MQNDPNYAVCLVRFEKRRCHLRRHRPNFPLRRYYCCRCPFASASVQRFHSQGLIFAPAMTALHRGCSLLLTSV